jgi:aspartyl-tRNA(Asn)/glutamyl-tRNA(Gln) amidotransferase subunit C
MEIKDIENLAELAKIELSEDEKVKLLEDLDRVLGYVKIVQSAPVSASEAKYSNINVWREDELAPRVFSHEKIISQFSEEQDNFLKVKKIL